MSHAHHRTAVVSSIAVYKDCSSFESFFDVANSDFKLIAGLECLAVVASDVHVGYAAVFHELIDLFVVRFPDSDH